MQLIEIIGNDPDAILHCLILCSIADVPFAPVQHEAASASASASAHARRDRGVVAATPDASQAGAGA